MSGRARFPISAAFALDGSGKVIPAASASIEIRRESDGALASISSDKAGGSPLTNPFSADSEGKFTVYAVGIEDGYQLSVTFNAVTLILHNIPCGTAAQFDMTSYIGSLASAADRTNALIVLGLLGMVLDFDRVKRRTRLFMATNYL